MSGLRTRLRNAINDIAYWTIPPAYQDITGRQWNVLKNRLNRDPEMEALFQRNIKFKDIHKGQRCFILATGPSINRQDLRPLKNEICIAVSSFYFHDNVTEIAPLYHIEAPNHTPYGWELPKICFENYAKYYSNKTIYFLGHNSYEFSYGNYLKQNHQYGHDNIYYLNYTNSFPLDGENYNNHKIWDICSVLFTARTVIYSAIQLAIYMSFKEIYLLGCDHDYLLDLNKKKSVHFYNDDKGFDDSSGWMSTEDFFLAYYLRWKQYRLMQEYISARRSQIFNATEAGLLDVFPRVKLRDIVNTGNK